jgi:RNA polymerase sigma-70 factor (ECF subfamily)
MVVASTSAERMLHQRLMARDISALAEAYGQFASGVCAVALRVTADRHAAEDVTQETLLDLWRRPERYHPERGGLRTWLATVAHNRSVDWIRREQAARGRDRRNLDANLDAVPDVSEDVQAVMTAERVRLALSSLPEPERTPIRLAYFGGRSYRQVAEELDVPEGTVKSRIRSGLRKMSQTMHSEQVIVL